MFSFVLYPVTYSCNLKCPHCCVKPTPINLESSFKAILTLNSPWVFITGGEPLLLDSIISLCSRLRAAGKKVGLTTNGTIHNLDIFKNVDRIGISIDGDIEFHDSYRGEGTFDKAVKFAKEPKTCELVIMSTIFEGSYANVVRLSNTIRSIAPNYWQISRDVNNKNIVINDKDFNFDKVVVINEYPDRAFIVSNGRMRTIGCNSKELLSGADPIPEPSPAFKTRGWARSNFWQLAQDKSNDVSGVLRTYLDVVNASMITGGRN